MWRRSAEAAGSLTKAGASSWLLCTKRTTSGSTKASRRTATSYTKTSCSGLLRCRPEATHSRRLPKAPSCSGLPKTPSCSSLPEATPSRRLPEATSCLLRLLCRLAEATSGRSTKASRRAAACSAEPAGCCLLR